MTQGISFTIVIAPVTWYSTFTLRTCSHGLHKEGVFAKGKEVRDRHWHVLEKLKDSMGNVLQCAKVYTFIMAILLGRHIAVIFDDLAQVLRWKILRRNTLQRCHFAYQTSF